MGTVLKKAFLLAFLFAGVSVVAAHAEPAVILTSKTVEYPLGLHMSYLEDPSRALTVGEVASPEYENRFRPCLGEIPYFGFTRSAYWVRFELADHAPSAVRWLLRVGLVYKADISLYRRLPESKGFEEKPAGKCIMVRGREVQGLSTVFELHPSSGAPGVYFMRFQTDGLMVLPLTVLSEEVFSRQQLKIALFEGIFYGVLLIMAAYNLVLFGMVRDKSYAYLVLYIVSILLTVSIHDGLLQSFLPSMAAWMSRKGIMAAFTTQRVCLFFFFAEFLRTSRNAPKLHRLLFCMMILSAVFAVLCGFLPARLTTKPFWVLYQANVFVVIAAALLLAFKRHRPAYYFLAAWFWLLVGGSLLTLARTGFLRYHYFIDNGVQFGMIPAVLLLSLGQADRIIILKREREKAHLLALKAGEELEEKNLALSRMDRIKDEFLANTSHELRTPLSAIIGLSESLLGGVAGGLPPKAVDDISMVAVSARRLAGLVDDILDFSLLKNQGLKLQKKAVDLHSLADIALAMMRPLALERGIEPVNAIAPGGPYVDGDEDRLLQIFFNLIGNAVKFTERGEVRVSAVQRGDFVDIAFSDTGPGIPAECIESLFLPFERGDSSVGRSGNGVGLGLAISRNLAQLHGGELRAESTPGEGSIFHLILPVSLRLCPLCEPIQPPGPTRRPPALPACEAAQGPSSVPTFGAPRVLAVDDDPINLQVIHNHLGMEGMEVIAALSGPEALALMESNKTFDIVLLDVMMPGMTGFEVCRRLRLRYGLTELPVIMLTARNRTADLIEGLECGANDYLGKPFARGELLARMRLQLKLIEAEEESRSKGRLAMLGQLAASIAHEVTTPINTIINSIELILQDESREELEQDAKIIKDEGRRIAGIVGGLLSFAHRGKEEKRSCRVDSIVTDTLRLIGAKLRKEKIGLLVDVPDSLPEVKANPQQIMQVFLNLVNNAAHALHDKFPEDHGDKTIQIQGRQIHSKQGIAVRLTFHDNGNGIPARHLDKVMKPFFTTKPAGMGVGLGLSVARGIIDNHSGTMRIESVEGEFTKVMIELPASLS